MAIKTLATPTNTFPRNRTKSPTELMANTRSEFLERIWKARLPAGQKELPFIDITM